MFISAHFFKVTKNLPFCEKYSIRNVQTSRTVLEKMYLEQYIIKSKSIFYRKKLPSIYNMKQNRSNLMLLFIALRYSNLNLNQCDLVVCHLSAALLVNILMLSRSFNALNYISGHAPRELLLSRISPVSAVFIIVRSLVEK